MRMTFDTFCYRVFSWVGSVLYLFVIAFLISYLGTVVYHSIKGRK